MEEDVLACRYPQHSYLNRSLRIGHWCISHRLPVMARFIDLFNRVVFSADVPCRMSVPIHVFFMHNGLGTVVDEGARFEGPILIMQHSTIGHAFGGRAGVPSFGTNVIVGAGATIVGGIKIGNNCLISAGAVVTRDMPDGHRAVGNPATITAIDPHKVAAFWDSF